MKVHFSKHGTRYAWLFFYLVSLLLIPINRLVGDDPRIFFATGFIFGALIARFIFLFFAEESPVVHLGDIKLSSEEWEQFESMMKTFADKREEQLKK